MVLYHNTRRVDKNIYKSINLSRAAFSFRLWVWNTLQSRLAATTCPYYIYFTIPNSEIRSANFGIRNSEFGIRNCEVV